MQRVLLSVILVIVGLVLSGQEKINPDGYNIFYYENGKKSSEGMMRDGKPDGYWKTYNKEEIMISEGNRKDFLLDSTWRFYNDSGMLKMEIDYRVGKKDGYRKTYREEETVVESFKNDVKNGPAIYYYPSEKVKSEVNFIDGLEEGLAKEYAEDGRIITLITYKNGYIIQRERINGYIEANKKHGIWKSFYVNGQVQSEGYYKRGVEHGYFKDYDTSGNLVLTTKYENGIKIEDAKELVKLEVRKDYYADGTVKIAASYNKEGKLEGVRREYAEDGTIDRSYIFKNGIMIGEGIVTEKGERDGYWKEYYDSGVLKAEGKYDKDIKVGSWKFYHPSGNVSQEGMYDKKGKPEGEWRWYYDSGALLRAENYFNGLLDGTMTEFDEAGKEISRGEYIEGLENGDWFVEVGDSRIDGKYSDGMRNGLWKYYYIPPPPVSGKTLRFEGRFIDDNPDGDHTWYWDNGKVKDQGRYVVGRKEGDWVSYDYEGLPFVTVTFKDGKEVRYDGIKIDNTPDE